MPARYNFDPHIGFATLRGGVVFGNVRRALVSICSSTA
jgi:hypothetical protein